MLGHTHAEPDRLQTMGHDMETLGTVGGVMFLVFLFVGVLMLIVSAVPGGDR